MDYGLPEPELDEDFDYANYTPGDPALRTLVGLIDVGDADAVRVGLNSGGQVIEGQLISSVDYAAEVGEIVKAVLPATAALPFTEFLLTLGDNPGTEDDDPKGFLRADYVHLRTPLNPAAASLSSVRNGTGLWYWRGSLTSVNAWWMA